MAKKGLAGGYANQIATIGASWSYIWYPAKDRINQGFEHVPMMKRDLPSIDAVQKLKDCPYWLVFNEPDYYNGDGYLKPEQAAVLYKKLRDQVIAVAPKTKFIVGGLFWVTGMQWLDVFRSAYKAAYGSLPIVDGWHFHHYADASRYTKEQWRNELYVAKRWVDSQTPNAEIWLTEYGCLGNGIVAERVMYDQTPWLDEQPWLARYAWYTSYSTRQGNLFVSDTSTQTTKLGAFYATINSVPPEPVWKPPVFENNMRTYADPSIEDGCQLVLEYGNADIIVKRYVCCFEKNHSGEHIQYEKNVRVSWV